MCVYKIEEIAERIRPVAEKYKAKKVYLFGSYARGEATEESDVDLKVEGAISLRGWGMGGLYAELEEALEKEIDLVTTEALKENLGNPSTLRFAKEISSEEKLIYERAE